MRSACEALSERLGEPIVPVRERSVLQDREQWSGQTATHIVYIAHDEATSLRITLEAQRIEWASSIGIPTPPVVDATADWLVYTRVPADPKLGATLVDALCSINDRIERAAIPPPGRLVLFHGHRASRTAVARRYLRLLAHGVDLVELKRVTKAVRSLPADALSHGDSHPGNFLYDAGQGVVRVVDWETLSYQPPFKGLLRMWAWLRNPGDRERLLDHVLSRSPDRAALALLHVFGALTHRNHAVITGKEVEPARALLDEARRRAEAWRR